MDGKGLSGFDGPLLAGNIAAAGVFAGLLVQTGGSVFAGTAVINALCAVCLVVLMAARP